MKITIDLTDIPLAGTVTIGATITPPVQAAAVTRVEFWIDNVLKSTDTTSPYSYSWDTTAYADGQHNITVKGFYPRNRVIQTQVTRVTNNTIAPPPPPDIDAVPTNTTAPAITGTATEGQTLTVSTGAWTNSPSSYSRQWIRCDAAGANCVAIASATGTTYTLTSADVGATIRCAVTAYNFIGASAPIQTAQTAVVAALAPSVPVLVTAPTISGVTTQGQTLSVSNGSWTNAPTSYTRQWQRCDSSGAACASITGATAATYVLVAADVGKTIRCVTTAINATGSSAPSTSAATSPVAALPAPPPGFTPGVIPAPPMSPSAMPAPPVNPQTINISGSSYQVNTAISDKIFNVTGEVAIAIQLNAGGSLTRCVVNCNGNVGNVAVWGQSVGTITDVSILDSAGRCPYGTTSIKAFGSGVCYANRIGIGFQLDGTGVTLPANGMIKCFDCDDFGVTCVNLHSSTFSGLIYSDYAGGTALTPSATGFEILANSTNNTFAYILAKRSSGYGAGVARFTDVSTAPVSNNRLLVIDLDGAGSSSGSDPGLVISGGTIGTYIQQGIIRNHALGITIGEYDYPRPSPPTEQNVRIDSIWIENCAYGGLRAEYGAGLTVGQGGGIQIRNCRTVDLGVMDGALTIGRSGTYAPSNPVGSTYTGVAISNLVQDGSSLKPKYAVSVANGSQGSINGTATEWLTGKVLNNSSQMTINV